MSSKKICICPKWFVSVQNDLNSPKSLWTDKAYSYEILRTTWILTSSFDLKLLIFEWFKYWPNSLDCIDLKRVASEWFKFPSQFEGLNNSIKTHYNIARYNLIDTKHSQMAFQSLSDGAPISPNKPSFETPGQTKGSGDRQRETTHEICCLAAE